MKKIMLVLVLFVSLIVLPVYAEEEAPKTQEIKVPAENGQQNYYFHFETSKERQALLDHFAINIISGMMASRSEGGGKMDGELKMKYMNLSKGIRTLSKDAYTLAEAMMKERDRRIKINNQ